MKVKGGVMGMDVKKTGELIAHRRKELGLTQKELAGKLHISDRAVSKWERGINLPNADLFESLCAILGLSVMELLRGERSQAVQPLPEEVAAAAYKLEVLEKEEKKRRRRGRRRAVALVILLAIVLGIWLGRPALARWRAQAQADRPQSIPSVDFKYRERVGYLVYDADRGGMYGPFESDGTIETRADSPGVRRYHGEESWQVRVVDGVYGGRSVTARVQGVKSEMTTQVLRWPSELWGTDADFQDGEPVEFYWYGQSFDWWETDATEGSFIFDVEPGNLYSVIFQWGEGYYQEYLFAIGPFDLEET